MVNYSGTGGTYSTIIIDGENNIKIGDLVKVK